MSRAAARPRSNASDVGEIYQPHRREVTRDLDCAKASVEVAVLKACVPRLRRRCDNADAGSCFPGEIGRLISVDPSLEVGVDDLESAEIVREHSDHVDEWEEQSRPQQMFGQVFRLSPGGVERLGLVTPPHSAPNGQGGIVRAVRQENRMLEPDLR